MAKILEMILSLGPMLPKLLPIIAELIKLFQPQAPANAAFGANAVNAASDANPLDTEAQDFVEKCEREGCDREQAVQVASAIQTAAANNPNV